MALYIGIKNLIGKGAAWLRSKWSTIVTQLLATFRYRVAGGSDNALLPERNGRAVIDKIYGKTVKFNQLVQNGDFSNGTTGWSALNSTITAANNVCTLSSSVRYGAAYKEVSNLIESHKVFICTDVVNITSGATFVFSLMSSNNQWVGNARTITTTGRNKHIESCPANATRITMGSNMVSGTTYDVSFTNVQIHDLTAIFGTDAEIAAALGIAVADITTNVGVAAFENWLALNPGPQDDHPYDKGSLISFKGQGVKVTGWNKFHVVNGSGVADVKKDVKYYVAGPFGSLHYSDGTAISVASDRTFTAIKDDTITFGSVSNSIVLNIYTGTAKDGTYEPYHEDIVDLSGAYINVWDEEWEVGFYQPDGTFTPRNDRICSKNFIKVNPSTEYFITTPASMTFFMYDSSKAFIDGSAIAKANQSFKTTPNTEYLLFYCTNTNYGNTYNHDICINVSNADINGTYYPHALQSAGSVTDEDTATELTKKLGIIKFKDLTWTAETYNGHSRFNALLQGAKRNNNTGTLNAQINNYGFISSYRPTSGNDLNLGMAYYANSRLYIRDDSISPVTPEAFVAKMTDTDATLIYELATPVVVPHDTPMQYAVDKYSTEEVIVPASAAGEPTSTAIVADIEYQAK